MSSPNTDAYRQQHAHAWTRVEMLIELYEAAIRNVDYLIEAHRNQDPLRVSATRTKAMRIIFELLAGLDHSHGEIPQRVAQLCGYMQHELLTGGETDCQSVRNILVTLRDAFDGIRDEAAKLERDGKIHPLQFSSSFKFTA